MSDLGGPTEPNPPGGGIGPPPFGQVPFGERPASPPPPPPGVPMASGSPPPNYLVWAILSTILCCLPLGIVSIVFAAQVNGKWAAGDVTGARASSNKAKNFAIASAAAGVAVAVLYLLAVAASESS